MQFQLLGELLTAKKILRDRRLPRYTCPIDLITKLRLAGNQFIHLTDAGRALFVAAVAPVVEEQCQRFGHQLFSDLKS